MGQISGRVFKLRMLSKRRFEGWNKDSGFMKQLIPQKFWLNEKQFQSRAQLTFVERFQIEEHDHEFF